MNQVIPHFPSLFFVTYRVVCCPRRLDGLGHARFPSVHRRESHHGSLHPFPAMLVNAMVNLHPRRHHMGKCGAHPHGPWSRRGAQPWYATVLAGATPRRTRLHRLRNAQEILAVPRYILLVLVFITTMRMVDRPPPIIGIMDASTYVLLFITPINVALNVYFVHYTDFGIYGSPIALSFTFSFAFFFLIIYTAYSPAHKQNGTWGGFQLRTVLDARSCIALLKLALPGILMVGTEWCVIHCPQPFFTPVMSVY